MNFNSRVISLLVFTLFLQTIYSQNQLFVPQTAHVDGIKTMALSPNGKYLTTAGFDNILKIWEFSSGNLLKNIKGEPTVVNTIQFINDSIFITGDNSGNVVLHNLFDDKTIFQRKISSNSINSIIYDSKHNIFWCSGFNGLLQGLSKDSLLTIFRFKNFQVDITSTSLIPSKNILLLGSTTGKIYLFDTEYNKLIDSSEIFSSDVSGIENFNNGQEIIASSYSGEIKFFSIDKSNILKQTNAITSKSGSMITSCAISPSGKLAAISTIDNDIHLINTSTKVLVKSIHDTDYTIAAFIFKDDSTGLTCSFGSKVNVLDLNNQPSIQRQIIGNKSAIADFATKSKILAYFLEDNTVSIIDLSKPFESQKIFQSFSDITTIAITDDGSKLAIGDVTGRITVIRVTDSEILFDEVAHSKAVITLEMNNSFLISASEDKTAKVFPIANLSLLAVKTIELKGKFTSITYSNKLQLIGLGTSEGIIYFVDPFTGKKESTLSGHSFPVTSLDFSEDGNYLASTGIDYTTRVWNTNDLFNFKTYQNNAGISLSAIFIGNEKIISTGDGGKIVSYLLKKDSTEIFDEKVSSMLKIDRLSDNYIVALSAEGLFYFWDIDDNKLKYIFFANENENTVLDFSSQEIFSSITEKNTFKKIDIQKLEKLLNYPSKELKSLIFRF